MRTTHRIVAVAAATALLSAIAISASASTPGTDSRLSLDASNPGYVTSYFIATGDGTFESQDATIQECSRSRGRQNEPRSASIRGTLVILGSANDYCGVYTTVRMPGRVSRSARSGSATTAPRTEARAS